MSNSNQLTIDFCSVCCQNHVRAGNTYCSKACRTVAYDYRKRLAPVVKFLNGLGFHADYDNGVELVLYLPLEFIAFYPDCLQTLRFPDPSLKIADLNADNLWLELTYHLGMPVGSFLRWTYEKRSYTSQQAIDLLTIMLNTSLTSVYHSFTCEHCEHRFITSLYSHSGENGLCAECAIDVSKAF